MVKRRDDIWNQASCRGGKNRELFFLLTEKDPTEVAATQIDHAKNICRSCPVRNQCLDWALESGQDAGVWGGMTAIERRELKRRAALPPTQGQTGMRRAPVSRRSPGHGLSEEEIAELDE